MNINTTINLDDILNSIEEISSEETAEILKESISETAKSTEENAPLLDFDAIVTEWSYRCDKGYPDMKSKSDLIKLQEILDEMGVKSPFKRIKLTEAKPKPTVVDTSEVLKSAKKFVKYLSKEKIPMLAKFLDEIPDNTLTRQTISFLETLSGVEAKKYAEAFKSLPNVPALEGKQYLEFKPLWDLNVEKAMGKGELYIAFMVKGAVTQGSSESFDVAVGNKHYEVKSLDSYKEGEKAKVGSIRPGAEGKVSRHPYFTSPLMSLASTIHALKNSEIQSTILTLGKTDKMEKILYIVNSTSTTRPQSGNTIMETPGDVPKSVMGSLYNAAVKLNKEAKGALNKDVTTSRIKIKSPTKDAVYWITPDDVDDIAKVAGKDKEASIKVGVKVTDETKDAKILLLDLINHPFVKNPELFTQGMNRIKQEFFKDKAGLVYFLRGITHISAKMADFATIESSQDGYKFDLKSKYAKWPHVQLQ